MPVWVSARADRPRGGLIQVITLHSAESLEAYSLVCGSGCSLPSSRNPVGADDESLGGGAHKIEWVTGHQGEEVVRRSVQHFSVLGRDHLGRVHAIAA